MLFAFLLMRLNGIPGDLISFGGVAIALGMIIDATIIMVEKIQTLSRDSAPDRPVRESVLSAAGEVGRPIFFAVSIIILVFLPIFTLGEVEGKMFRPLAFTVAATMAGSLIYALLIAPVLYECFHASPIRRSRERAGSRILILVLDAYEAVLRRVLGHPVLVTAVLILLLAFGSHTFLRLGREFIPSLREGTIQCLVHMSPNIALDEVSGDLQQHFPATQIAPRGAQRDRRHRIRGSRPPCSPHELWVPHGNAQSSGHVEDRRNARGTRERHERTA